MTSTIEQKAILSGAAVLGLFLIIAAVQYRTILNLVDSLQAVSHTLEVLEELARLQYSLNRCEDAARVFALAGGDATLQAFRRRAVSFEYDRPQWSYGR